MRGTWVLSALLAAVLAAGAAAASQRTITLTKADDGRTVRAHVGDQIVLGLASNPSTGYSWKIVKRPAPLRVVSTRYVPPKTKLVGAPGKYVATFAVRTAGKGTLRLVYVRATRPPTPAASTFSVRVVAS